VFANQQGQGERRGAASPEASAPGVPVLDRRADAAPLALPFVFAQVNQPADAPAPVEMPPWQQSLREMLQPLTSWIPPEIRDLAPVEVWWLVLLIVLLLVLILFATLLKQIGRAFARKAKNRDWDKGFREDLDNLPMPVQPPGERTLAVYHIPVRLRLVVVAPMGKDMRISTEQVPGLLNRVFPELGSIVAREQPAIRIWPAQISDLGFNAAFHRRTPKPEPEGEPSRWILIAGRALLGKQPFLLALAFYSEQPNPIGRLNLQPLQWLEVLRMRDPSESPSE